MTDINTWNATDDNNNTAAPAGWPEGMMPSGVNNSARAMMGSIKRWRDQAQPTVTATGGGNAQIITYTVAPAALASGDSFTFLSVATNTGPTTLQVNAQAATAVNNVFGAPLVGGEMPAGTVIQVYYLGDGTFRLAGDPGAVSKSGVNTIYGPLTITGADLHLGQNMVFTTADSVLFMADGGSAPQRVLNLDPANTLYVGSAPGVGIAVLTAQNDVYVTPVSGNFALTRGSALKSGGGLWTALSDTRTKEAVADYTAGLSVVTQLRPVSYKQNGRGGATRDGKTYIGLVADDAEAIMPEMIGSIREKLDPDDAEPSDIKTLDGTALIYALVNSVRELTARVKQLETALVK